MLQYQKSKSTSPQAFLNPLTRLTGSLTNFSNIIQDIRILLSEWEPETKEQERLQEIADKSTDLVDELLLRLNKYQEIGASNLTIPERTRRAFKRMNWDQNEIQEWRDRMSLHLQLLNSCEKQLASQRACRIEQGVHHLVERSNQQERDHVLNWIATFDHGVRQSNLYGKREEGTGEWFISSEKFQRWVESKDGLLFCPGPPGAGKTILASIVIQNLLNHFGSDRDTGIAYHYCDFQQEGETFDMILSSILRQFAQCSESLPDDIQALYNKYKDKGSRPDSTEISNALETVASMYSRCLIVIDGLDECAAGSDVVAYLRGLPGANILVTCRDYPDIVGSLEYKGGIRLEVRAMDADVRRYLDRKMRRLDRVIKHDQQLRNNISDAILAASGGMFLLARLHVEYLAGMMSIRAVKNAVAALPTGTSTYDDAYDNTMRRIESQPGEEATKAKEVLAWLTFAKRPLRIEELPTAIIVEETDTNIDEESLTEIDYLASVCAGLVDIRNGSITLIHSTTKEYLKRRLENWRQDPNAAIATSCLTYLLFPTFDVEFSKLQEYPQRQKAENELYSLLEYSLDYVAAHVRLAKVKPPCVDTFLSSDSKITKNWLLLISKRGDEHGESVAKWLIQQGVCTEVCDPQGRTPLHYAVLNGWKRCVSLLLERGVILSADIDNMTPLHYTVKTDAEDIALAFINAGISVNTPVARHTYLPSNYYGRVAYGLKDSEKLLVQKSHTEDGLTSLHLATLTGSQRMTRFFLDHGANPNFRSESGETPLNLALRWDVNGPKRPNVVDFWNDPDNRLEFILEYTDFDDGDDYYSIRDWIQERRLEIIDLLLDRPEVDVNAQDNFGFSPLHIAANNKYLSGLVVQKLIDKGADISLRTSEKKTPLHLAVASRNDAIVPKLLAIGANPTDTDSDGLNALHYAVKKSDLQMLQVISTLIPDSSSATILQLKDNHGQNVLHHLMAHGCVDVDLIANVVKRVHGVNDVNDKGMTPMAIFLSVSGFCKSATNEEILDLLFEHGADPSFTTPGGLSLAHLAAGSHRVSEGILRKLASQGISLTAKDERGRTVLHHASIEGSLTEEVLCYLHEEVNLPLDIRDKQGKTALDYAIEKGKEDHRPNRFRRGRWKATERLLRGMEKEA
ncbi:hypothetical protein FIE12Z_6922 [Fusarium flagelliforme]|uniref:Uncharacterized protein n=1 Tax=Fusarium flagelliforme TaxID=2675880 RepID=A0A395MM57_9HYPO|nr:hypothetical protein FIE12Z_6922 [Fusarium flagelliforme]